MSGFELKIVTKERLLNAQIESKRRNNGGFLGGSVTRELNQAAVSLIPDSRALNLTEMFVPSSAVRYWFFNRNKL